MEPASSSVTFGAKNRSPFKTVAAAPVAGCAACGSNTGTRADQGGAAAGGAHREGVGGDGGLKLVLKEVLVRPQAKAPRVPPRHSRAGALLSGKVGNRFASPATTQAAAHPVVIPAKAGMTMSFPRPAPRRARRS